ncbi:hypothetical protein MSG28_004189 [Choristoneura fumiferana]|uniref:Uncharacterized protein n=1 Tax=Choristoneura fumiferana TaxID=7141 RepID=A0ACC0KI40_CHOFU|nr:hypothetical protein MSG28_004189 [Choristoneura fumiferana]
MPLRRTPPPANPAVVVDVGSATQLDVSLTRHLCDSEPELATKSMEGLDREPCNVTHRLKRRRGSSSEQLNEFMTEVKNMFMELRAHQSSQDSKMEKISSAMDEIKAQNLAMQSSVEFIANRAVTNLISAEDERLEVMNEDSDDSDRNDDGGRTGHHNRPRFY